MLCILSVSKNDASQAAKLAGWIRELGNVMAHECVLAISRGAFQSELHKPILEELNHAFRETRLYVASDIEDAAWPRGANHGFIRVCKDVIQNDPMKPFLWLEPDAIPLNKEWLNEIEREYIRGGKPFMGAFVDIPGTLKHMSGVAVYRQICFNAPSYVLATNYAWDVVAAKEIIPKAHFTKLIQHDWKPDPFTSKADMARIHPAAVLYHQDKTGSLIDLLRGYGAQREVATGMPTVGGGSPNETAPLEPLTIAGKIRQRCAEISKLVDGMPARKAILLTELRKQKLIAEAVKRKGKKCLQRR